MIKPGFDFIAPAYDALSFLFFGSTLRKAQLPFLAEIPAGAKILLIGGGTGWLLKEITRRVPVGDILYLEASGKMLQLSQHKLKNASPSHRVEFRLGTEKNLEPREKFDFIISPFILDLYPPQELGKLCQTLYDHLNPTGKWQVTDFVIPNGRGFWPVTQKLFMEMMYIFFRVVSQVKAKKLPDWEKSITTNGLAPQKSVYFSRGMVKSVLYQQKNCDSLLS
jgi:tRNA (cmo5U34)-methyltransferase